jgi:nucleoside-diphosphate-sugar epimerase
MRYFVTGATGFVGGRVARQLAGAGHQVVAVVRDPEKASDLASLGVEIHRGDVTDKESMREPMRGVDGVFHIAAWYKIGARDKSDAEKVNVQGTRNVLELMKELWVPKGVYTSTTTINGDTHSKLVDETYRYDGPHFSEYNRTKWMAHYDVAVPMIAGGLPLVIVMPSAVYGPGDKSAVHATFVSYLRRKLPMVPAKLANSWGHVDDVAQGHILAMEKGRAGEAYIIGGEAHTVVHMLKLAEKTAGVPLPRFVASPRMLNGMAGMMGLIEKAMPVPYDYTAEFLHTCAGVTNIGSNAKAKRVLGYNPRSLEEGVAETVQYEMQSLGMKAPPAQGGPDERLRPGGPAR